MKRKTLKRKSKSKIVITIPAFNEEKTIGKVLREIGKVMSRTDYSYQLMVMNDGSKDRTVEIARKNGAKVFSHLRNRGLAETFKSELKNCLDLGADIIVHTDADGQYDSRYIPKLIKKVEEGYDLVVGSRFSGKIESMPLMKRFGNIAFSKVLSHLTAVKLTDTTSGFRAFTKEVAEDIHFINTFTYTQEQIIRAARQKFRIAEIPITARKTRDSRLFKSPFQYAWRAWVNILRIYRDYDPLKFFGKIAGFFITLGLLLGFYIIYLALTVTLKEHVSLILFDVLIISLGIQIVLFGFLADMLKK